jgi:rubredoxin
MLAENVEQKIEGKVAAQQKTRRDKVRRWDLIQNRNICPDCGGDLIENNTPFFNAIAGIYNYTCRDCSQIFDYKR